MTRKSALDAIAKYCNDLDLMEQGASFADLGISDRRKAMRPEVICLNAGQVVDRFELTYEGDRIAPGSIARLKLSGTMYVQDGFSSRGIESMARDIEAANANPNISGILIEANTGGGESLAGQMLKNAVKDSRKPVLVYAHYLGSAGVHGSLPADYIMAAGAGTEIGSIGTLISINKQIVEWYNENVDDIYSDASPNKNREWREYLKGNKQPFIDLVKNDAQSFQAEVQKYRDLKGDVSHTLSGAMLPAPLALERGLIDGIGTFQDALNQLASLIEKDSAGASDTVFVNQQESRPMFDKLLNRLNEKFGWNLGQDATDEDVFNKVEAVATERDDLKSQVDAQNEKINSLTEKAEGLQSEMATQNDKFSAELEAMKQSNADLAAELKNAVAEFKQTNEEREKAAKEAADKIAANVGANRNGTIEAGQSTADQFRGQFSLEVGNLYES